MGRWGGGGGERGGKPGISHPKQKFPPPPTNYQFNCLNQLQYCNNNKKVTIAETLNHVPVIILFEFVL